jgi:battenin
MLTKCSFGYVVFLSAAEDIIQGNSGAVLLADILPTLITKLTAPFFMQKISYRVRVVILVAAAVGSFQMVAWGNYVWVKIIGVVLASFSAGFGEITFLALASFYPKNTLSAWSSGTGGAGIAGSVTYLALTVWIALSNRNSLLVVSPLPLLILLSFFVILTGKQNQKDAFMPLSETETKEEETYSNERIEYAEGFSSEAESKDEKEKTEGGLHFQFQLTPLEDKEEGPPSSSKFSLHLKIFHQLVLLRPLLKYMIPLFLVYYFEYVINQGIAPTIVFSGWSSSEAYKYYQLMYVLLFVVTEQQTDCVNKLR